MANTHAHLRQHSDESLQAAQATGGVSEHGVLSFAFQAGYLALLSAFEQTELAQFTDHPNAEVALEGAERLGLPEQDQVFAQRMAENYSAHNPQELASRGECLAWSHRVRRAV